MRGKDVVTYNNRTVKGITPAHAGKRLFAMDDPIQQKDHPRTCGEKNSREAQELEIQGSPPHMRGKEESDGIMEDLLRITPAHAGKSNLSEWTSWDGVDHPRTCGEK